MFGIVFSANVFTLFCMSLCSLPLWIYAIFCIFLDFHGNLLRTYSILIREDLSSGLVIKQHINIERINQRKLLLLNDIVMVASISCSGPATLIDNSL